MDFLFKSYYVFFQSRREKGAAAAAILLSIPLGISAFLGALILLSFVIDLKDIGGMWFGLLGGSMVFLIGLAVRHSYVTKERYLKMSPMRNSFFYGLFGVIFYIGAIIIFLASFVALLGIPQQS